MDINYISLIKKDQKPLIRRNRILGTKVMTGRFRYNSSEKRRLYAKKTPRMLMKQNITKIRLKHLELNIKKKLSA